MKRLTFIALMILLQFSCSNENAPASGSEARLDDSLEVVSTTRITPESDYFDSFRSIKKKLDSINISQKRIYQITKDEIEYTPDMVNEINQEINRLNALLLENKTTIQNLNHRLANKSEANKDLTDSIQVLNQMLSENQGDLMILSDLLDDANYVFDALQAQFYLLIIQNAEQNRQIGKSMDEANTVWYTVGTLNDLKKNEVIIEEGGVLGMWKRPVLNNELDSRSFRKIDLRYVNAFPLNSKNATILTLHSTQSYKFIKENNKVIKLSITDPKEFWRLSKYLVILEADK